jgi:hypothetical protein
VSKETEHEKLWRQLSHLVEQPEPSTEGNWLCVPLRSLLDKYEYIEIHFNEDNSEVNMVRLSNDEDYT